MDPAPLNASYICLPQFECHLNTSYLCLPQLNSSCFCIPQFDSGSAQPVNIIRPQMQNLVLLLVWLGILCGIFVFILHFQTIFLVNIFTFLIYNSSITSYMALNRVYYNISKSNLRCVGKTSMINLKKSHQSSISILGFT